MDCDDGEDNLRAVCLVLAIANNLGDDLDGVFGVVIDQMRLLSMDVVGWLMDSVRKMEEGSGWELVVFGRSG